MRGVACFIYRVPVTWVSRLSLSGSLLAFTRLSPACESSGRRAVNNGFGFLPFCPERGQLLAAWLAVNLLSLPTTEFWWPAHMAGKEGRLLFSGRRISHQIFALELYMLFGLSELSHKKIKYQLLFLKFDLSKMPQCANWRSHIMLAGNLDKYPIP